MKEVKPYAEVPNVLIEDARLHYTTKRVAFTMLLLVRKNREIRQTICELAAFSGCSPATVQQAVQELEAAGYLRKKRNYRYSYGLAMPVNAANTYRFRRNRSNGYTLIPAEILKEDLTPGAFAVLLYLYRCAGRTNRAYPSLRYMANDQGRCPGIAKATVCRAVAALKKLKHLLDVQQCKHTEKSFRANSYILYVMVLAKKIVHRLISPPKSFSVLGGLIFEIRPPLTR